MRSIALLSLVIILPGIAHADLNSFTPGPVIEDYGPVADVDITVPVPKDTVLRHRFDVAKRADDGELNRSLVSAARFLNMHARAGISHTGTNVCRMTWTACASMASISKRLSPK